MEITRQTRQGVTFYACGDPVWDQVAHGFSTRLGGVSEGYLSSLNLGTSRGDTRENVEENVRRFRAAIGATEGVLVKNHQVHGTLVRSVTGEDGRPAGEPPEVDADGLVTDQPGVVLAAFSADCLPILFYDPVRRCVAAVHAGWRGTANGIAAKAVEAMAERYGCEPQNIHALIGPGISCCCFETTEDVPSALRANLGAEAERVITDHGTGKFHVDLKKTNAIWLERSGVVREHISICDACTACDGDSFWSHRIIGDKRGSMAAMISLRKDEV